MAGYISHTPRPRSGASRNSGYRPYSSSHSSSSVPVASASGSRSGISMPGVGGAVLYSSRAAVIGLARGFQRRVPAIESLAPAELLKRGEKPLALHAPAMLPGIDDDQISHSNLLRIVSLTVSDCVDAAHQRLRFKSRSGMMYLRERTELAAARAPQYRVGSASSSSSSTRRRDQPSITGLKRLLPQSECWPR